MKRPKVPGDGGGTGKRPEVSGAAPEPGGAGLAPKAGGGTGKRPEGSEPAPESPQPGGAGLAPKPLGPASEPGGGTGKRPKGSEPAPKSGGGAGKRPKAPRPAPESPLPPPVELPGGVPPTPLREEADSRYRGRGVTMAFVDSGFFPHPDLTQPRDRILAYHDATGDEVPLYAPVESWHWHGTMTSVVAAGSGYLSAEVFRGIASEADVVLVKASSGGRVPWEAVAGGLRWLLENRERYRLRVVNVSLGVDDPEGEVLAAVTELIRQGVVVVAAAGNSLDLPESPGEIPEVITVGGYAQGSYGRDQHVTLYTSSFGLTPEGILKPELIAPAVRVASPILPGTPSQKRAEILVELRETPLEELPEAVRRLRQRLDLPLGLHRLPPQELRRRVLALCAEHKVVDRNYEHADGTSVAAPIVASVVAQMLEANPRLTPAQVKTLLVSTADRVARAPVERQGFGMLSARRALEVAQAGDLPLRVGFAPPRMLAGKLAFYLYEPEATSAHLAGDFNGWSTKKHPMTEVRPGLWRTTIHAPASGTYRYKFVVDGGRWVEDPANMRREPDGYGGMNAVVEVR